MSFRGEVKSYNATKGYGFIVCGDFGGKDIFLPKTALGNGSANAGDQVAFDVNEEPKGPVAANCRVIGGQGGHGGGGRPVHGLPQGPPIHHQQLAVGAPPPGPPAGPIQDMNDPCYGMGYLGTVKAFNREKGYGMISCAAISNLFGRDAFCSARIIPGGFASPGERVFFTIKVEEKGPAVDSMEVVSRPEGMMPIEAIQGYGGQPSGRTAFAPPPQPPPPQRIAMPPPMPAPVSRGAPAPVASAADAKKRFYGAVRAFNEEKGWGHIDCDAAKQAFGKDVFLLRNELPDRTAEVGSLLCFKVLTSAKGPQAAEISIMPPGSFAFGGRPGETFQGEIKTFNPEKKWGFISGVDIQDIFKKDIFASGREFTHGPDFMPNIGDQVQFTVQIDERKGQPEAKQITVIGGGGALNSGRSAPY